MSGVDQFASAASFETGQELHTFTGAVVTGVNPDGTVDVRFLGEDHPGIESLASYTNRLVGDVVMIRDSGSRWTILGKIGGEASGSPNISWGTGSPVGSDWETSTSVKVRPGQVYVQGTFAAENYNPTPQPIVEADTDRAFQVGVWNEAFSGRPAQGAETVLGYFGSGAWAGGWEYGTSLQSAVAAKAVRSMELRIERGSEPDFGLDEPVTPRVYVHNSTSFGGTEPSAVAGPYNATPLNIGQSAWWQVPQVVIDLFTANSAKGFMIKSTDAADFMVMAEFCGDVRITN